MAGLASKPRSHGLLSQKINTNANTQILYVKIAQFDDRNEFQIHLDLKDVSKSRIKWALFWCCTFSGDRIPRVEYTADEIKTW